MPNIKFEPILDFHMKSSFPKVALYILSVKNPILKREEQIKKDMERQERERRKEEERLLCEKQREEERYQREQWREMERREKNLLKESARVSFDGHSSHSQLIFIEDI